MSRASLLVALGAALILGTSAAGAPTWGRPLMISIGDRAVGPDLALNPAGDALVVWDREVGSSCPTEPAALTCSHRIELTASPSRSGTWRTPVEISRPGIGARPRAAINASGSAAILWVHDIGRDRVVQASYVNGSSPWPSWPEPNDVSEPSLEVRDHHIALDASGNALAVWAERATTNFVVRGAIRNAASGAWSAAAKLSATGGNTSGGPSVALRTDGHAVVAWIEDNSVVRVTQGDAATGVWESPVSIPAPTAHGGPEIATNAMGDIALVWARGSTGSLRSVQSVFRSRDGSWTQPVEVGIVRSEAIDELQIGIDGGGDAVAMWVGDAGVQAAERGRATGNWPAPVLVSAPMLAASDPRLAIDAAGNAVAVWVGSKTEQVQTAIRPGASGPWQPPVVLSGSLASKPGVALDSAANALAVWNRESAPAVVVESASLDGSGPLLVRLRAPARAFVGVRARFSVEAVPWAAPLVGPPRWRFGDGRSTTGARASHAYARPGRYRVRVTSTDARATSTTSTRWVRVLKHRAWLGHTAASRGHDQLVQQRLVERSLERPRAAREPFCDVTS